MKASKLIVLSTVAAVMMLTVGCGDSSSTATTAPTLAASSGSTSTTSTTFTVERGPLLGASVVDANNTVARELGNGQYIFDKAIEYPVSSTGGYIDVNRNGLVDAGEVKNTLKLETKEGSVVTLATTMSSNAKLKAFLVNDLGIDVTAILEKTPSSDKAIEALSDSVFKYAMENNITDASEMNDKELVEIKGDYESRYQTYKDDNLEAKEHESNLINSMSIVTLDDAEAQSARVEIETEVKKQDKEFKKFQEEVKKLKESGKLQESGQTNESTMEANSQDSNQSKYQESQMSTESDMTTDAMTNTTTADTTTATTDTTTADTTTETTDTTTADTTTATTDTVTADSTTEATTTSSTSATI